MYKPFVSASSAVSRISCLPEQRAVDNIFRQFFVGNTTHHRCLTIVLLMAFPSLSLVDCCDQILRFLAVAPISRYSLAIATSFSHFLLIHLLFSRERVCNICRSEPNGRGGSSNGRLSHNHAYCGTPGLNVFPFLFAFYSSSAMSVLVPAAKHQAVLLRSAI